MDNIKNYTARIRRSLNQAGVTIVELLVVISISSVLFVSFTTIGIYLYGDTVRSSLFAQLATESQNVLRSIVEELRQSSSIRTANANTDANSPAGGWTTSNSNLILIISSPALNSSNQFIINPDTGNPYQNEIVYFSADRKLYKRFIANPIAGNTKKTTCPSAIATSTCPPDILLTSNFKTMNFVFYDQDDAVTTVIPDARSIKLLVAMDRRVYGKTIKFDNSMRITIRNTYP